MTHDLMRLDRGGSRFSRIASTALLVFAFASWAQSYWQAGGWISAAFAFGGLLLLLSRSGVTIDRANRLVTEWWGLGFPILSARRSIEGCSEVLLSKDMGRRRPTKFFRVQLIGQAEPLEIALTPHRGEARRQARQLAGFLGIDFVDAVDGMPLRVSATELDEAVRDRHALSQETLAPPSPREGERSTLSFEGGRLTVTIPGYGLDDTARLHLKISAVLLFIGFASRGEILQKMATGSGWDQLLALAGGATVFLLLSHHRANASVHLQASSEGLVVTRRWLIFRSVSRIDAHELREMAVRLDDAWREYKPARPRLLLAGSEQVIVIDQGLSQEELDWLRAWLLYAVSHEYAQKVRALVE